MKYVRYTHNFYLINDLNFSRNLEEYDPNSYRIIKSVLKHIHYYIEFLRQSIPQKKFDKYITIRSLIDTEVGKVQQTMFFMNREIALKKGDKPRVFLDYGIANEDALGVALSAHTTVKELCGEYMTKKQMKVLQQKDPVAGMMKPSFFGFAGYRQMRNMHAE